MLNLFFISDSPKVERVKNVLQPVLKVIIDVVPDFDRGLKDVIEKRPTTVCVQDQIAGVTGESVARHIKMLLGTGAPTFILIHEGSSEAKLVKGIFEYIIDLSQPEARLAEEIQSTLKVIIGDQWDKVFIPPQKTPASIGSSAVLSKESRGDADKLGDVFLSDFKLPVPDESSKPVQTSSVAPTPKQDATPATTGKVVEAPKSVGVISEAKQTVSVSPPVGVASDVKKSVSAAVGKTPPVTPPSEFRIIAPAGKKIPEYMPLTFEEDYRSKSNTMKRTMITAFVLLFFVAIGVWYFVKKKPDLPTSSKQQAVPVAKPVLSPVSSPSVSPPLPAAQPVPTEQKPVQAIVEKPPAPPAFPSFIPRDGLDKSFAANNPGWERYVGKEIEFRVFSVGGKTKALQTLATNDNVIPDSLVKTVLTELAGSADYLISSRENKSGFLVLRGTVAQKADVLFYTKESTVHAFVVSLY